MTTTEMQKSRRCQAFLIALGISALIFLPFIIYDGGYFIYYGDFNVQQIPFYRLAHEAVRSGDIWWSWYTDLGANFIGSYSFYLLFSPFFWLTLPFPSSVVPLLMAPLLMLKTACAALTSYLYLERFVKDRRYAVLGSLLYAFSGWMFFNVFFNHFHDVAVFFPLMLLSVELLVVEKRKGLFAMAVAINAIVNYWFFVGEVVFLILYVLVRMTDKNWGMTWKKFLQIALEAILGVGVSAVVMLPSVLAIMGNPRTGTDSLLSGWNFWLYWHQQRQPAIISSLFLPPDLPARPNFFPDHGAKWSSLSAWLPFVGMTGVLAWCFNHKKDWLKRCLCICLLFALVPGLNSLFILFNHSYYARWFYMPILLMALASIRALEESEHNSKPFSRSIRWCMAISALILVVCGMTPNFVDGQLQFGMAAYPDLLAVYAVFVMLSLVGVSILVMRFRHHRRFLPLMSGLTALICVTFGIYYISNGKQNYERSRFVINTAIKGRDYVNLPEEPFARADVYDGMDNLAMFWGLPNIQAFHSIVPPSIMEFYPEVGVTRDVGSRPEAQYWALRPLLSVRWLFIDMEQEEQNPIPGFSRYTEMLGYNVYENDNYIPMGFAYTHFVPREQMEDVAERFRSNLMLRAVVLDDDVVFRHHDILEYYNTGDPMSFSANDMAADAAERRSMSAYSFERDKRGFTARTDFDRELLLFFSVPWEEGWTATVNGEPAEIDKVNIGFMAVRVPPGDVEIRFDYTTPGLGEGAVISGISVLILLAYFLLARKSGQSEREELDVQKRIFLGETVQMSWTEYLEAYHDSQKRRSRLQQTLNDAESRRLPEELPEEDQTLMFSAPEDDHNSDADKQDTTPQN